MRKKWRISARQLRSSCSSGGFGGFGGWEAQGVFGLRILKKRMGISKNSIGWFFSGWAKRPMQEDLSVAT